MTVKAALLVSHKYSMKRRHRIGQVGYLEFE